MAKQKAKKSPDEEKTWIIHVPSLRLKNGIRISLKFDELIERINIPGGVSVVPYDPRKSDPPGAEHIKLSSNQIQEMFPEIWSELHFD